MFKILAVLRGEKIAVCVFKNVSSDEGLISDPVSGCALHSMEQLSATVPNSDRC